MPTGIFRDLIEFGVPQAVINYSITAFVLVVIVSLVSICFEKPKGNGFY